MSELIKITKTESGKIVSARELHLFLEVETKFNDWILRMFEYGFELNVDYIILLKNENKPQSKSNPIDYGLTLDTAKEISMMQRNEKGKQARKYFRECEKALIQKLPSYQIENPIERANAWIEEQEEKILLVEENKKLQFRSDFVDVCFDADGVFSFEEVCKILKLPYGRNTMMAKLRELGVLLQSNTPKQNLISNGYFKVVETLIETNSKFKKIVSTTYATQKGIGYIHKLLNS